MALAIVRKYVKTLRETPINDKQRKFCDLYVSSDKEFFGNATKCYAEVYNVKNYLQAKANAGRLINNSKITAYINDLLSEEGFNDQNVDKQHLFLINQHKDLNVKMKGIEHYNKLKKRVENKLEIIMPKPIMALEDDEAILKIDKKSAIDIPNDGLTEP